MTDTGPPLALATYADGASGWGAGMDANLTAINAFAGIQEFGDVDYTIHADGSGYYARHEPTGTQPFTGADLSSVWNAVAAALNNGQVYGSGGGYWDSLAAGGSWALARKVGGGVHSTDSNLFVYSGQSCFNMAPNNIIKCSSSFPNTGTLTNGLGAVISAGYGTNTGDTALRVRIVGMVVDGNGRAFSPYLYRRNITGSVVSPGANGLTRIIGNEGYNYGNASGGTGIHIGLAADAVSQTGSSNAWIFNNFIHGGLAGTYAFYNATGDVHVQFNNFVQDRRTGSFVVYLDELATFLRDNHIGWQGSVVATPNANIYVNSGGGHFMTSNYIDNAGANGQAAVEIAGGSSIYIGSNHVNWLDSDGSGKACFYVDGSQTYIRVVNNRLNGPTSVADGAEIFRAGAGAAPTSLVANNAARGVKGFFQGTQPAEFSGNQITNIAGVTQSNGAIKVKAGAPVDGDYIQAYNGIHAFDSTNVRDYWRMNGTWRYSAMT